MTSLCHIDGSGHGADTSDSLGGTIDDQDELSDASVDEESNSGLAGEPLSREPSESLFNAEFQAAATPQESPGPSDTADLLGLTSDLSSTAPPQPSTAAGGMKASSSNSDLLNDLFAPTPSSNAQQGSSNNLIGDGGAQEDLFFSNPAAPPDSATPKRKRLIDVSTFCLGVSRSGNI